jgi:hypothetical protein
MVPAASRHPCSRGGRENQRNQQHHHRRVVDQAADTGRAKQHSEQSQTRPLRDPGRQTSCSRLQRAGDHKRVAQHHQGADRDQRGMAEAGEEPGRVHWSIGPGIRHQHETQRNGRKHRQTHRSHRPAVPDESGEHDHGKQHHRQAVLAQRATWRLIAVGSIVGFVARHSCGIADGSWQVARSEPGSMVPPAVLLCRRTVGAAPAGDDRTVSGSSAALQRRPGHHPQRWRQACVRRSSRRVINRCAIFTVAEVATIATAIAAAAAVNPDSSMLMMVTAASLVSVE